MCLKIILDKLTFSVYNIRDIQFLLGQYCKYMHWRHTRKSVKILNRQSYITDCGFWDKIFFLEIKCFSVSKENIKRRRRKKETFMNICIPRLLKAILKKTKQNKNEKRKKSTSFECQFNQHESTNWGHYRANSAACSIFVLALVPLSFLSNLAIAVSCNFLHFLEFTHSRTTWLPPGCLETTSMKSKSENLN